MVSSTSSISSPLTRHSELAPLTELNPVASESKVKRINKFVKNSIKSALTQVVILIIEAAVKILFRGILPLHAYINNYKKKFSVCAPPDKKNVSLAVQLRNLQEEELKSTKEHQLRKLQEQLKSAQEQLAAIKQVAPTSEVERQQAEKDLLSKVVVTGEDLHKARVIFFADIHSVTQQAQIRTEVFNYLQTYFPVSSGESVAVLIEAWPRIGDPDYERLHEIQIRDLISVDPILSEEDQIKLSGWEDMSLRPKSLKIIAQTAGLQNEAQPLVAKHKELWNQLKTLTSEAEIKQVNEAIEANKNAIEKIASQIKQDMATITELGMERTDAMFPAVEKAALSSRRVFVIAGEKHLIDPSLNHNIISYFKQKGSLLDCALVIPKTARSSIEGRTKHWDRIVAEALHQG